MAPHKLNTGPGREFRLDQLQEERQKVFLKRFGRDPKNVLAELAELDGLIRGEKIRLGIDEKEAKTIDWNECLFHAVAVWLAVGVVVGTIKLFFTITI